MASSSRKNIINKRGSPPLSRYRLPGSSEGTASETRNFCLKHYPRPQQHSGKDAMLEPGGMIERGRHKHHVICTQVQLFVELLFSKQDIIVRQHSPFGSPGRARGTQHSSHLICMAGISLCSRLVFPPYFLHRGEMSKFSAFPCPGAPPGEDTAALKARERICAS